MELISKELSLLEEGKVYEFSQTILNKCKRLIMRSKFGEALAIATECTKLLLERGETESSLDFLEVIAKASASERPQEAQIEHIAGLLPAPHDSSFVVQLCKVTEMPEMYSILARLREDEGNISDSLVCWANANDFRSLLRNLYILIDRGYPGEEDLFVGRTVLLLLSMAKGDMANNILRQFPSLKTPLINFSQFMIEAVEAKEIALIQILKEKYAPSLRRDPELSIYIEIIEKKINSSQ